MSQNISRRTMAKGAAWSVPAVVATSAIPAFAASAACSVESKAAIDAAFALEPVNPSLRLSMYQPLSAPNDWASDYYINLKNTGDTPITFTTAHPLQFRLDFKQDAKFETERTFTRILTSWGSVNRVGYDSATGVATYLWTFVGTIKPGEEADMVFGTTRLLKTWISGVTSTVDITPVVIDSVSAPELSSIVSDADQQAACADYYEQAYQAFKSTVTTNYYYEGPKATGVLAPNTTINSADMGNYAASYLGYDLDGIF